jgi:hypothetical protein
MQSASNRIEFHHPLTFKQADNIITLTRLQTQRNEEEMTKKANAERVTQQFQAVMPSNTVPAGGQVFSTRFIHINVIRRSTIILPPKPPITHNPHVVWYTQESQSEEANWWSNFKSINQIEDYYTYGWITRSFNLQDLARQPTAIDTTTLVQQPQKAVSALTNNLVQQPNASATLDNMTEQNPKPMAIDTALPTNILVLQPNASATLDNLPKKNPAPMGIDNMKKRAKTERSFYTPFHTDNAPKIDHLMYHEMADTLHDFGANSSRCTSDSAEIMNSLKKGYQSYYSPISDKLIGKDCERKIISLLQQQNPKLVDTIRNISRAKEDGNEYKSYLGLDQNNNCMGILYDACQTNVDDIFTNPMHVATQISSVMPGSTCLNIGTLAGEWDEARKLKHHKILTRVVPKGNIDVLRVPVHKHDLDSLLPNNFIEFVFTQERNYVSLSSNVKFDLSLLVNNITHLSVKKLCRILTWMQHSNGDVANKHIEHLFDESLCKYNLMFTPAAGQNQKSIREEMVNGFKKIITQQLTDLQKKSLLIFDLKRSLDYGIVMMADFLRKNQSNYDLEFVSSFKKDVPDHVDKTYNTAIKACKSFGIITSDKLCYMKAKLHDVPAIEATSQAFVCNVFGQKRPIHQQVIDLRNRILNIYNAVQPLFGSQENSLSNFDDFWKSAIDWESKMEKRKFSADTSTTRSQRANPTFIACHAPLDAIYIMFTTFAKKMQRFQQHVIERLSNFNEIEFKRMIKNRIRKKVKDQWETDGNSTRIVAHAINLFNFKGAVKVDGVLVDFTDKRYEHEHELSSIIGCAIGVINDVLDEVESLIGIMRLCHVKESEHLRSLIKLSLGYSEREKQAHDRKRALFLTLHTILTTDQFPHFELQVVNDNIIKNKQIKYTNRTCQCIDVANLIAEYHASKYAATSFSYDQMPELINLISAAQDNSVGTSVVQFMDTLFEVYFQHTSNKPSKQLSEIYDSLRVIQQMSSDITWTLNDNNEYKKVGNIEILQFPNHPIIKYICAYLGVNLDSYDLLLGKYLYDKNIHESSYSIDTIDMPLVEMPTYAVYTCPYRKLENCYSALSNMTTRVTINKDNNISADRIYNIIYNEYKSLLGDVKDTFQSVFDALDNLALLISPSLSLDSDLKISKDQSIPINESMGIRLELNLQDKSTYHSLTSQPIELLQLVRPKFTSNVGIQKAKYADIFDPNALSFINNVDLKRLHKTFDTEAREWTDIYKQLYEGNQQSVFQHYGQPATLFYGETTVHDVELESNSINITCSWNQNKEQKVKLIKVYARVPIIHDNIYATLTDTSTPLLVVENVATDIGTIEFKDGKYSISDNKQFFGVEIISQRYLLKCMYGENIVFFFVDVFNMKKDRIGANDPDPFKTLYDILDAYDLKHCEICDSSEKASDMLLCDNIGCNRAFHASCLKINDSDGQFICHLCVQDRIKESDVNLVCSKCEERVDIHSEEWKICPFNLNKKNSSNGEPDPKSDLETYLDDKYGYNNEINVASLCKTVINHSKCKPKTLSTGGKRNAPVEHCEYYCNKHCKSTGSNVKKRKTGGGPPQTQIDSVRDGGMAISLPLFDFSATDAVLMENLKNSKDSTNAFIKHHVQSDVLNHFYKFKCDKDGVIYTDVFEDLYNTDDYPIIIEHLVEFVSQKNDDQFFTETHLSDRIGQYISHLKSLGNVNMKKLTQALKDTIQNLARNALTRNLMNIKLNPLNHPSLPDPSKRPGSSLFSLSNVPLARAAGGSKYTKYSFFSDSLRSSLYKRMVRQLALKGGVSRKQLKGKGNKYACSFIDETFF